MGRKRGNAATHRPWISRPEAHEPAKAAYPQRLTAPEPTQTQIQRSKKDNQIPEALWISRPKLHKRAQAAYPQRSSSDIGAFKPAGAAVGKPPLQTRSPLGGLSTAHLG